MRIKLITSIMIEFKKLGFSKSEYLIELFGQSVTLMLKEI